MAKICIVLATYNGEKYLSQMLSSLVAQKRKADLIIAVDDGSKDSSVEILKQFQDQLPLKIHVSPQNQGHRAAFEKSLEFARQQLTPEDLIALADQDDVWLPQKLELLEKEIEKPSQGKLPDLVFGDAQVIDSEGNITYTSWRGFAHIDTACSMKRQIAGINNVTGCLCLFRANLLQDILPIPAGVTVHDRWIAMLAERRGGIVPIDNPVIQYRIHENNAVGGKEPPKMSETLRLQAQWIQTLLDHRQKLFLTPQEIAFGEKFLKITQKRLSSPLQPLALPWLFANRQNLFITDSFVANLKRACFSAIGLPLAKKLWGKS